MLFPCKIHGDWDSNMATACPTCMAEARGLLVRCFLELEEHEGHTELKEDIRTALGNSALASRQEKVSIMRQSPLYTTRRCRNNGNLYGSTHGSISGENTTCGKKMDHRWSILTNRFDGEVTCIECIKAHNNKVGP